MDLAHAPTGLAAVPADSEGARAFLQHRVSLFARFSLVLGAIIQGVLVFVWVAARGQDLASGSDVTVWVHPIVLASFAAIWLRARGRPRTTLELAVLDVVCVALPIVFSLYALWPAPVTVPVHVIHVLSSTYILILRAVLIPGGRRRTLVLGLLNAAVAGVWTWLRFRDEAPVGAGSAIVAASLMTVWATMGGVVIAGVASYTIFGLRQRVREAMKVGQYTLLRKIGEGGMGVVWEARHALLRRRTAVKLLPAELAGEEAIARFEREVQLTSALTHPNTIAIYDYGRSADGVFYYAMEFLDGLDLQDLVDRDGPQPPGLVAHVLAQVSAALAEAHSVGLVHRDVKPANVILCERGGVPLVAKVLDFGLVKHVAGDPGLTHSQTNVVLGTPLYMAPEAMTTPSRVDGKSDIYAVGAMGWFMLVGRPLFEASSLAEICAHHLHTPPRPPSEVLGKPIPADLEQLILACLEKDPAQRPPDAGELAAKLAATNSCCSWTREDAREAWNKCCTKPKPEAPPAPAEPTRMTVAIRS